MAFSVEQTNHYFATDPRITQSLLALGVLTKEQTLRDDVAFLQRKIDTACQERGICDHGIEHHIFGMQNALVLRDIVAEKARVDIADATVIGGFLLHDIGYASRQLTWQNFHAVNHAERGRKFEHYALYRMPQFRDHPLWQRIRDNHTSDVDLIVECADKLDYFRQGRVNHLHPPSSYRENPYFHLAAAVERYTCFYNSFQNTLQYQVCLMPHVNFTSWYQETLQGEGNRVWPTLHQFAATYGIRFEIVPS